MMGSFRLQWLSEVEQVVRKGVDSGLRAAWASGMYKVVPDQRGMGIQLVVRVLQSRRRSG